MHGRSPPDANSHHKILKRGTMTSTKGERREQADGEGGGWWDVCWQIIQTDSDKVLKNIVFSMCSLVQKNNAKKICGNGNVRIRKVFKVSMFKDVVIVMCQVFLVRNYSLNYKYSPVLLSDIFYPPALKGIGGQNVFVSVFICSLVLIEIPHKPLNRF